MAWTKEETEIINQWAEKLKIKQIRSIDSAMFSLKRILKNKTVESIRSKLNRALKTKI